MSRFIKNADLDKKLAILAAKAELKVEQDKILKLQAFTEALLEANVILKKIVLKII